MKLCLLSVVLAITIGFTHGESFGCQPGYKYDINLGTCRQPHYKEQCEYDMICLEANSECLSYYPNSNVKRCLCKPGYFPGGQEPTKCFAKSVLQVHDILVLNRTTTTVSFSWTSNNYGREVTYFITNLRNDNKEEASPNGGISRDLEPGNQNIFTVNAYLKANDLYTDLTVKAVPQAIWTKPATPGPFDPASSQLGTNPMTFAFFPSAGNVGYYQVTLTTICGAQSFISVTIEGHKAQFNILTKECKYEYSIIAFSHYEKGEGRSTGSFYTSAGIGKDGPCKSDNDCRESLICNDYICDCDPTSYYDEIHCQSKKENGALCSITLECKDALSCIGGKCGCESFTYYDGAQCQPRKQYGASCSGIQTECMNTLSCVKYMCGCDANTFYDGEKCLARDRFCMQAVDHHGQSWDISEVGITNKKNCPQGYTGIITKKCMEGGKWGQSSYVKCISNDLNSISQEIKKIDKDGAQLTSHQITDISASLNSSVTRLDTVLSGDIVQVVDILQEVVKIVDEDDDGQQTDMVDSDTLENFANAADVILSADDSSWKEFTDTLQNGETDDSDSNIGAKLVINMDKLSTFSLSKPFNSSQKLIVKPNIVIKRNNLNAERIVFPGEDEDKPSKEYPWILETGNKISLSTQNMIETIQYSVIMYNRLESKVDLASDGHNEDVKDLIDLSLGSDIISFSLSTDVALTSPLELQFQVTEVENKRPKCGFLDTTTGPNYKWSEKGCETKQLRSDLVQCQCNHLTNFAILMSPYESSGEHHEILSILTFVGCGISILCFIITIVMHAITWRYCKEDRAVLRVHLSVVLTLAFALFLAGIDRTDYDIVCTVIAALLHYLFLAVFFILLAEGIEVLKSVTFVFSLKSQLWSLLLMIYSMPLIIVGVCLGITQTDGYRHEKFCWLSIDSGFLWGFVGPVLLVILINIIIIFVTLVIMMGSKYMEKKDLKKKTKSAIRAIVLLSPTFGVTWLFGVLSVNESLVTFQYLFVVFSTLQGFFVFLFHCLLNKQIRDGFRHMMRKQRTRSFATDDNLFFLNTQSTHHHGNSSDSSNFDSVSSSEPPKQSKKPSSAVPRKH